VNLKARIERAAGKLPAPELSGAALDAAIEKELADMALTEGPEAVELFLRDFAAQWPPRTGAELRHK
jgi:hypothetical protein